MPSPSAVAADDLGAEVQRAVTAESARDLSYYERVLGPKSVYIAEDGMVISGRDRVLRTFGLIFSADPPRRIETPARTSDGGVTRPVAVPVTRITRRSRAGRGQG